MSDQPEIQIRKAVPADLQALAKVNHDVWQATYGDIYDPDFVAGQTAPKMEKDWQRILAEMNPAQAWFVAQVDGRITAYAGAGRVPDMGMDFRAELYSIYVLSSAQRQGLGSRLLGEAARFLNQAGADSLLVWIAEALPASDFYLKHGAAKLANRMEITYGGRSVRVAAYGWMDTAPLLKL
jgi:GNAT superfamily N-acetyltransferase